MFEGSIDPRSDRRIGKRGEQKRRWDNENLHSRLCPCGARIWNKAERCRPCTDKAKREARDVRYREIESRWLAGESLRQIGAAVGMHSKTVGFHITTMRQEGWNVPYRNR